MKNVDTISKLSSIFYAYSGGKQFRKKLDYRVLESLDYPEQKQYLQSLGYRSIGRSTSRNVYLLSSKKVLKLAVGSKFTQPGQRWFSISQNTLEYQVLSSGKSNFLPKVYGRAPDYSWIEVELVRPLKSYAELTRLLGGIPYSDYEHILTYSVLSLKEIVEIKISHLTRMLKDIEDLLRGPDSPRKEFRNELYSESDEEERDRLFQEIERWKNYLKNPILIEMIDEIHTHHIPTNDLDRLDNLGVNTDGHLVFLDVGYQGA